MTPVALIKRALLLCIAGLLIQLGATLYWTPLTFIAFAAIGLPLVLAGSGTFLWAVWRLLAERGAL